MKKFTFWMIVLVLVQIIAINSVISLLFMKAHGDGFFPWQESNPEMLKPVLVKEMIKNPIKKNERLVRKLENNDIISVLENKFVSKAGNEDVFRMTD